jgi:hypothetical protein
MHNFIEPSGEWRTIHQDCHGCDLLRRMVEQLQALYPECPLLRELPALIYRCRQRACLAVLLTEDLAPAEFKSVSELALPNLAALFAKARQSSFQNPTKEDAE